MSNYETERFREYLFTDRSEANLVKLDLKVSPWEVVGRISGIGEELFTITNSARSFTFKITDIRHYRLA